MVQLFKNFCLLGLCSKFVGLKRKNGAVISRVSKNGLLLRMESSASSRV